MEHTEYYQLSQWEADDRIQMEDFNADNAKIDAALAGMASTGLKIATGSYTGDGTSSRVINLGVTPKAVLLFMDGNKTTSGDGGSRYGGLAVTGQDTDALRLCENGFIVYCESYYFSNLNGTRYTYLAIY